MTEAVRAEADRADPGPSQADRADPGPSQAHHAQDHHAQDHQTGADHAKADHAKPDHAKPDHAQPDESLLAREIEREQRFVDRVYARLEAAADSARQLAADGHARARLGNQGGLVERDAIVFQAARRLAALDAAHEGLVFGRLDLRSDATTHGNGSRTDGGRGDTRYIGRVGLRDADRESLLVDWRAPAAAVFYQATAEEPSGVVRRRVLHSHSKKVVGIEDELLDAAHASPDLPVIGEGALLAALGRARSDHMQSVVATIQREQDQVIRAPQRGATVISGGPGTGKTVVALHRAAYLLYTDRRRYEHGGVLIVGPNPVFMAYIERVLPSLGETTVSLRAIGEVVDGIAATRHDDPELAVVKGSARMARLLAQTVRGPVPGAPAGFRTFYRDDVLRLDERRLADIRRRLIQAAGGRRNRALPRVFDELVSELWEQVSGHRALEHGRDAFANEMRGSREFVEFCRSWWPHLDGAEVLNWLADPKRLARDADGILAPIEVERLTGSFGGQLTVEDVPLVDELRYLLGEAADPFDDEAPEDPLADLVDEEVHELTTFIDRTAGHETGRPTTSIEDDVYAHVLVDEAQDLSPMQWRMLGRRGRASTWTIVGDAAQSAWPLPGEAATARDEALRDKQIGEFRLSTNYRNSREIFDLAGRYARSRLPGADLPNAVRATGVEPVVRQVTPDGLADAVRSAVAQTAVAIVPSADQGSPEAPDSVARSAPDGWAFSADEAGSPAGSPTEAAAGNGADAGVEDDAGTVAVVAPTALLSQVTQWLSPRPRGVRILSALDSKGLEFDAVVVVEPDRIVDESPAGAHTLYVVLTRATRLLHVVSTTSRWEPAG